jgi:uncharacterized repeat protein (TIGR01451 family)
MRSSKGVIALCAVVVMVVSSVAIGGALISGSTGKVVRLSVAPPSVKLNALQHRTNVYAFDERQGATLPSAVAVDAMDPGTYTSFPPGSATIAAGTQVNSHLIHSDIPPRSYTARRTGTVTFSNDIIGVVASTNKLAASDTLGAPGTLYAGTTNWRGLESSENGFPGMNDRFTISADRRTVSFDFNTYVMDEIRVITSHAIPPELTTTISDSPDPVTAGNDVQYTLTVTNTGIAPVGNAHVVDTLPPGTTLFSAPPSCTGTGPVDCALGTLAVGESAEVPLVVTSPSTVPPGGTITNTAVASPGDNAVASETTTVEAPTDGVAKGFVSPGGSITIPGDDPATLTLPNTGPGAPVVITQGDGTFCDGPCDGTTTTISDFPGYNDPNEPIHVELVFNFPADDPNSLTNAAIAFGQTIYKNTDPENPSVGSAVPVCTTPGSGNAFPSPCVDVRTISQPTSGHFVVTFEIVYLSGDPKFGRR